MQGMLNLSLALLLLAGGADALGLRLSKASPDLMFFDGKSHTFAIENDQFMWDGQPVAVQAGEMHYFRIPQGYWEDRILRMKAAGFNTISTYVAWNFHEQDEGEFDFSSDMKDVTGFLELAKKHNMAVVFRPGPYICAEWTAGGLPSWLHMKEGIEMRTYNEPYIAAVTKFWDKLLPMAKPYLAENGGPIIMVQLENEYGIVGDTQNDEKDRKYMQTLKTLAQNHLGKDTVLCTCDPAWGTPMISEFMKKGGIDGVFRGINLQTGLITDDKIWQQAKGLIAQVNEPKKAPVYVAETYSGWFTQFHQPEMARKPTTHLVQAVGKLVKEGASFAVYMAHGGTNFGFWAGSAGGKKASAAFTTSYDYNSPIREAGDHGYGSDGTDKFEALRAVLGNGRDLPEEPAYPKMHDLGSVSMERSFRLHDKLDKLCHKGWKTIAKAPQHMEFHGAGRGMGVYRFDAHVLPVTWTKELPKPLSVGFRRTDPARSDERAIHLDVTDRSDVWLNDLHQGQGARYNMTNFADHPARNRHDKLKVTEEALNAKDKEWTLDVMVDTHGRRNFGEHKAQLQRNTKGLNGSSMFLNGMNVPVETGSQGAWTFCELRLDDGKLLQKLAADPIKKGTGGGPTFFSGTLNVNGRDKVADSYLSFGEGWETGVAFINGFNIGRYDQRSPQKDLYVPKTLLKSGENSVIVLETDVKGVNFDKLGPISFVDKRVTVA